jgi:hypothetical protein
MNRVLEGLNGAEMREIRDEYDCGINESRTIAITDRMISAVVRVEMHVENDELKEAILLQNDLLMTLITETRGRR